jgi:hypothetical protein
MPTYTVNDVITNRIDKKVNYGKARTAFDHEKGPNNEAIVSPIPNPSHNLWIDSHLIPAVAGTVNTATVHSYQYKSGGTFGTGIGESAGVIELTRDPTVADQRSWLACSTVGNSTTRLGDWLRATYGATYLPGFAIATAGGGNGNYDLSARSDYEVIYPQTTDEEYYWDYESGVFVMFGNPNSSVRSILLAGGSGSYTHSVYLFKGFRYDGAVGLQNYSSGTGTALTIIDESTTLSTAASKLTFAGTGITATEPTANEVLVTVPGGALTVAEINDPSANVSVTSVNEIQFDVDSGFALTDLTGGVVKVAMESTFKKWNISGQDTLIAQAVDEVTLAQGSGIVLTTTAPPTSTATYTVKVAASKFTIDTGSGDVSQPALTLVAGGTYKFDTSDSTNATHTFKFSTTSDGENNSGTEYTTNVTTSGTPGSANAYTQISIKNNTPALYYYCSVHASMGGSAATPQKTLTISSTSSVNLSAVAQDILPDTDVTRDLGSSAKKWDELYLSGNNLVLGNATIKSTSAGAIKFYIVPTTTSATLTTVGTTVTLSSGTWASLGIVAGTEIIADSQTKIVQGLTNNITLVIDTAFTTNLTNEANWTYQTPGPSTTSTTTLIDVSSTPPTPNAFLVYDGVNSEYVAGAYTQNVVEAFTGHATNTYVTLVNSVANVSNLLVFVESVFQPASTLSYDNSTKQLTFTGAASGDLNGKEIVVVHLAAATLNDITPDQIHPNSFAVQTATGTGSNPQNIVLTDEVSTENQLLVTVDNVIQTPGSGNSYTVATVSNVSTLTFATAPVSGAEIVIRYLGIQGQTVPVTSWFNLSQVSGSAFQSTDANKFVKVNSTYDGLEYDTVSDPDVMGSSNSYAAGLVLAGSGTHAENFLRKDGTWQTISLPDTMGSSNSYATGLVLAGSATHANNFLRKDGTWQVVSTDVMGSGNSYAAGLVLAGSATHANSFLRKDGTWQVVATDVLADTTPQLGGNLDVQNHEIFTSDNADTITIRPNDSSDNTGTVQIAGNLTVLGTTTTVSSTNLAVTDNIIVINKDEVGAGVTAGSAGIEIERGSVDNATITWNETDDVFEFKVGSDLVNLKSAGTNVQRQRYIATASQTQFSIAYTENDQVDVYLNGLKLAISDYTATTGTYITLGVGASVGDIVECMAFNLAQLQKASYTRYNYSIDGSTYATTNPTFPNINHESDQVDVFVNGLKIHPTDYSSTSGTSGSIQLSMTLTVGDLVEIVALNTFQTSSSSHVYDKQTENLTADDASPTYSITNGYTVGKIDVFVNGVKLAEADFTATNLSTISLADPRFNGDVIEFISWQPISIFEPSVGNGTTTTETFTATSGQTTFTLANAYTVGAIEVYLNGLKQVVGAGNDYVANKTSAPYTVVLNIGATTGDVLQTVAYSAFASANHYLKTETYTKTEVDTNTYTQTQVDALLHSHAASASFAQTKLTSGLILG